MNRPHPHCGITTGTRALAWVLLGAIVTVGGCRVDQAKEVATYRRVLDGPNSAAATQPAVGEALTLRRALLLANGDNEQLALKGEDYLQALVEKQRLAWSFLPAVNLSPSHTITGPSSGSSTSTSLTAGAQVNVFNGFREVAKVQAAGATAEQRKALLLDQQASVLVNVAQVYYQVLRAERSVAVLESTVAYQDERVRDTRARARLGVSRALDVAQTEADLAATRVSLRQARADAANGRSTLARLAGLANLDAPLTDGYEPGAPEGDLATHEQAALAQRQDLIAGRHALSAARTNVEVAFRRYYPSINVSFNYLLTHEPSVGSLWVAAISGTMPIFSAGQIEADVRQAWSAYRQVGLSASATQKQVLDDVRQAWENLASTLDQIRELRAEVTAARQALDLAERSYQLGNATNLDRLSAQNTLLSAQLQLVSEEYNRKIHALELRRATGRLTLELP